MESYGWTLCFNDAQDLCCLARLGRMDQSSKLLDPKKNHKKTFGKAQIDVYRLQFLKLYGGNPKKRALMPRQALEIFQT